MDWITSRCAECGETPRGTCETCRRACYCSERCFDAHWPRHKIEHRDNLWFAYLDEQREGPDNALVSPASIAIALRMIAEGARGETLSEITKWICDVTDLADVMPKTAGGVTNALWTKLPPTPEYAKVLREKYGAEVFAGDDIDAAKINRSVSRATQGMIKEIVDPASKDVSGVLLNAMWFSCKWVEEFDEKATARADFYAPTGVRECQMMYMEHDLIAGGLAEAVAVILPLSERRKEEEPKLEEDEGEGGIPRGVRAEGVKPLRLQMVVAVDPRGRTAPPPLPDVARAIAETAREQKVKLWLPRASLELRPTSLSGFLKGRGISRCFAPVGELPGFADPSAAVGDVRHAARLEWDEHGAKGAAATAGLLVTASPMQRDPDAPLEVRCDHPFFVGIRDRKTGSFLMAGYVKNP